MQKKNSRKLSAIFGILFIACIILALPACDFSNVSPLNNTSEDQKQYQEQALIKNIGELHNFVIKKLYEEYTSDEISLMLSSSEGLERMADIFLKKVKSSNLWSLPLEETLDYEDAAVSAMINIFSGNEEAIDNYPAYKNFMLFNLNNLPKWYNNYPNIEDYKRNISEKIKYIQPKTQHNIEHIMFDVLEASTSLWIDDDLVSAFVFTNTNTGKVNKGNFNYLSITAASDEEPEEDSGNEASEATCAILTVVADAEGAAIGTVIGGPLGGIIGGAIGSVVLIHASSNADVCYTD